MGFMPSSKKRNYADDKVYVNGRLISKEEQVRVKEVLKGLLQYCDDKLSRDFFASKEEGEVKL